MFSKHLFNVYLEEQQCVGGKKTNKQANLSVLISTVLLSRAVEFCPKLASPKGKQNEQRLVRNGKRLASAFSREDRAIRTLRVFKLVSYQSILSIHSQKKDSGWNCDKHTFPRTSASQWFVAATFTRITCLLTHALRSASSVSGGPKGSSVFGLK